MESSAINLAEEKSDNGGGEKEAGKKGQDGRSEEEVDIPGEMKQLASQVNQVICEGCGGRAGALAILPEELWFKVLEEQVDSAEDIRNVLLAFPELDKLFQRKKASWLFPLVLPHLMTKYLVTEEIHYDGAWTVLRSRELLKLRLVSKRWKKAVESSLENHSGRHPLLLRRDKHVQVESNVVAIPVNHFSYHRIRSCPLGVSRFQDAEHIDKFLEEMGDFRGNPFPGKSVFLQVFDDEEIGRYFRNAVARTVTLLQRFGEHVLDFQIDHWEDDDGEADVGNLELYRNMLRCLTLVPNLRSLIFTGDYFDDTDPERDNLFRDPESQNLFPELRNLESFEWRVKFEHESIWTTRMLNAYGTKGGLRKLGIPLDLLSTMDLALFQSINLTELHLFLHDGFDINVEEIGRVVKALPNHQEIRKLWLSSFQTQFVAEDPVRIDELVRMLADFKFESVVFQDLDLIEGPPLPTPEALPPAITVTSLDLEEKEYLRLSFNFLRELPNLKFLSVKIGSHGRREILDEYQEMKRERDGVAVDLEVGSFKKILTRYFMKAYDPTLEIPENAGIWNDVPSLEMLSLVMPVMTGGKKEENYFGVRFVRECGNRAFFGPVPDVVKWDE